MIEITAIRQEGGPGHEHITAVIWRSRATYAGCSSMEAIVAWLSSDVENRAIVLDGSQEVEVAVVRDAAASEFIRTRAGDLWTDSLLALPRF